MVRRAVLPGSVASSVLLHFVLCSWVSGQGWWVDAGPSYRTGMRARVDGTSHVQAEGVHAAKPYSHKPTEGGSPGHADDREYEDGYVKKDPGTSNDGLTWYWGYDDDSQVHGDTLSFHNSGRRMTRETVRDETICSESSDPTGAGAMCSAGYDFLKAGRFSAGVCVGLEALWGLKSSVTCRPFEEKYTEERYDIIHEYDVDDVNMPGGGHEGTYGGPFDVPPVIPSPLIENEPYRERRHVTSRKTWSAANEVILRMEADYYEIWLGPRLGFDVWRGLGVTLIPSVSMNAVDARMDRVETLFASYADGSTAVLRTWNDTARSLAGVWGLGVAAGVGWECANGIFAGVRGRYAWVNDDLTAAVGPNTVSLSSGGTEAAAVVGFRFGGRPKEASTRVRPRFDAPVSAARDVVPSRWAAPVKMVVKAAPGPARGQGVGHSSLGAAGVARAAGPAKVAPAAPTRSTAPATGSAPLPTTSLRPSVAAKTAPAVAGRPPADVAHAVLVVPRAEQDAVLKGEKVYRQMQELLRVTGDRRFVNQAMLNMSRYEPEEFAVLMAYFNARKAGAAQTTMKPVAQAD